MDREDLKRIRAMKLANDRHVDYAKKSRRDGSIFLLILTILVVALAAILVMGGFK
mgnify:CR=1 FL=1